MTSLRELGEVEVLRRLIAERAQGSGVLVGPGDDAALLELGPGRALVASTDTFVEGAHYLPAWSTPERIGTRLASANLSDLAAMAARPRWALVSIGARPESPVDALIEIQRGVQAELGRHGAAIVGGNLTAVSAAEWWTLTLLGDVPRHGAWLRSGARPGDAIAITGFPGRAGAGLALAHRLGARARAAEWQTLLDAWISPEPRVALARALAETGAVMAAIDVSDGLAGDLARLCEASGTGAELVAEDWPEDPDLERAAQTLGVSLEALRLMPSDDYELVLAVDPAHREACREAARSHAVPLAFIGRFTAEPGILTLRSAAGEGRPIDRQGYDPFGGSESG